MAKAPLDAREPGRESSPEADRPADRAPLALAPADVRPSDVLRLQQAAGNAAVNRLLSRQPAPPRDIDLINPYEVTPEEQARQAEHTRELREALLGLWARNDAMGFLSRLRGLTADERSALENDDEFQRMLPRRFSGMTLWIVRLILRYGRTYPADVRHLSVAVHARDATRIHELLMAYPRLRMVPGLRQALSHQFRGQRALTQLLARLDEGEAGRAESGEIHNRSAGYEGGVMHLYGGTTNFELVRTASQVRVIVRIRLHDDEASTGPRTMEEDVRRMRRDITSRWNGRFRLTNGRSQLDVWFVPVFVFGDIGAHHTVTMSPGNLRANEHHWYLQDEPGTPAHEFGHMLGNPDEYALPGTIAEIPAAFGLTQEQRRLSSIEGLEGRAQPANTTGYTRANLMGSGGNPLTRHLHAVVALFNARLKQGAEPDFRAEGR